MENLVSIIMPTYNCADFIEESIRSAQAQTMTRWELIVMDDCSTDDTRERVERMGREDARIQYHRLAENSGCRGAHRAAVGQGNYIAFWTVMTSDARKVGAPNRLYGVKQIAFPARIMNRSMNRGIPRAESYVASRRSITTASC